LKAQLHLFQSDLVLLFLHEGCLPQGLPLVLLLAFHLERKHHLPMRLLQHRLTREYLKKVLVQKFQRNLVKNKKVNNQDQSHLL